MSKLSKIQIISCGPGLSEINQLYGVSSDWIQSMIKGKVKTVRIVKAYLDEKPIADKGSGWIIAGSRYSAYDDRAWITNLKHNIQNALDKGIPVLGICFGHQILCSTLGAKIVNNVKGWEVGSSQVNLSDKGIRSPLFKNFNKNFHVYQSHHDVVTDVPKNVDVLCSNQFGIQAISFAEYAFGVQFHPEFSYNIMQAYFDIRTKDLDRSRYQVLNQNHGAQVISNFININSKEN